MARPASVARAGGDKVSEAVKPYNGAPLDSSIPGAPLESILCTEELHRRPLRPPDYERENCALVALVCALADSPRTILQTLADTILSSAQRSTLGGSAEAQPHGKLALGHRRGKGCRFEGVLCNFRCGFRNERRLVYI